jgi:LuxR family maltose regulon positive regulatory protein
MGARGALTDEEQLQARYGLARVHRAQGCHSAALEVSGLRLDGTDARSADATPGPTWTHRSLRADLAIAYGKAQVALGVVEPSVAAPADRATSWLDPSLTLARALLLQGERASTQRARDVLATVDEGDAAMRGCRFRLERHCLGALLAAQEEDDEMVAEEMHEALTLAERAGFLRYLVDFGAPLAELLKPFARHATLGPHARRVLAAYYEDTLASGTLETGMEALATETPHELLTPRESETLRLLSRGLANNEIAEQSFVSVDTVKTHLKNIYRKLNVRSRRQAVSRARAIGLLAEA